MQIRIVKGLWTILFILCAAVWAIIGERMDRALDGSLDESLESMANYASPIALQMIAPSSSEASKRRGLSLLEDETFFEVYSLKEGKLLAKSPALRRDQHLVGENDWRFLRNHDEDEGWDVRHRKSPLRCLSRQIKIPASDSKLSGPKKALLIVGVERGHADRRWKEIMIRSGIGLILLLLSSSLGTWFIVEKATRPLTALIQDVSRVTPESIQPVGTPRDPELALLADRVNASLASVARHVEREKRFSADVAHELLTPLGGLRTVVEVALLHQRPAQDLQAALEQCGMITSQMQTLVESLLNLSRLESGAFVEDREPLNLAETIGIIWADYSDRAAERGVSLSNQVAPDIRVFASLGLLSIVLSNLFSNVARYARANSEAWVECQSNSTKIELNIYNECDNPLQDFAEHAFDRFWRGDPSRSRKSLSVREGTGLGLSLARAAARAMKQDLAVEVRDEKTVRISIWLERLDSPHVDV